MRHSYLHDDIPELTSDFLSEGDVVVRDVGAVSPSEMMDVALMTLELARRLGIRVSGSETQSSGLPYSDESDNLVFSSPQLSALLGVPVSFLRGWKQYDSCIKGFNALGLMAEQVMQVMTELGALPFAELNREKREWIRTRKDASGNFIFTDSEVSALREEDWLQISRLDLALWKCFGEKTIVCSTSSNMGISLHQILRDLQQAELVLHGKRFTLLNSDEGRLVIWCPDPGADFMNPEKTEMLLSLAHELPPLTHLSTYINRVQRDPGALRDALRCGGYFFPTNPQSREEVQNLLFFALRELAAERGSTLRALTADPLVRQTLVSLRCSIGADERIFVDHGIEGGIAGLMVPYLIMLEELLQQQVKAVAAWNQASIGAALAAAVMADNILREPALLTENTRARLNTFFPRISAFVDSQSLGKRIRTRVHGVFDLANIQSLAQLLGVVVERHVSGRGSAYVGLGSSSYSNGNRCFEILRQSMESEQCFPGKSAFHPATHTLNPIAQALIFGEELYRAMMHPSAALLKSDAEKLQFIRKHVRKTEPAGAASLAGYLLARLDAGTLSVVELAFLLRQFGFSRQTFLRFAGLDPDASGMNRFFQEAGDEGIWMGELARNVLLLIDWPLADLQRRFANEHRQSLLRSLLHPFDDPAFTALNPEICMYLTGDNTRQPDDDLLLSLWHAMSPNRDSLAAFSRSFDRSASDGRLQESFGFFPRMLSSVSRLLRKLDVQVNARMNRIRKAKLEEEMKQASGK